MSQTADQKKLSKNLLLEQHVERAIIGYRDEIFDKELENSNISAKAALLIKHLRESGITLSVSPQ